ncbi:MAG TPA: zinc ribbon domain-containing protein [Solirubrobacteraceae bacterium]|nr:zinc ribbon domain-containing protein [Solirubrobacteraceae bacterium]
MTAVGYCYRCGTQLSQTARFCGSCGAPRVLDRPASQTTHTPPAALAPPPGGGVAPPPAGYAVPTPPAEYAPPPPPPPSSSSSGSGPPPAGTPESDQQRRWLPIVSAVIALLLVVGATAAVIIATSNGGSVHQATVITAASSGSVAAGISRLSSGASGAASAASRSAGGNAGREPSAAPSQPPLSRYHSSQFSAEIPVGWHVEENVAQKSGYVESKWRNPASPNDSVLIDASPARHLPLREDALPVHEALRNEAGYREIFYGAGDLSSVGSWKWVFSISGDQRVDYFFERCDTGFGVLGSTSPGRFGRLQATFRAVAQSVRAPCGAPGVGANTASSGGWPSGFDGYTVALASDTVSANAVNAARRARSAGLSDVGVLQSSAYSSLTPGYWFVFSGVYSSTSAAQDDVHAAVAAGFSDAYVRRVAR